MKLNEIKERRGALVAEMRSVLESAGDKGLTADQETSYQNMEKEFSRLSDEVKREEALAQKEAEMKAVTAAPISAVAPGTNPDEEPRNLRPTQRESYARAFGNYIRKRGGREVHNAMSEGTDSTGGYLVPEEWADYITTKGAEANVIRRYATVVQTANDRNFPIQTARAAFDWIAEAGAYDLVNPTLANEELKASSWAESLRFRRSCSKTKPLTCQPSCKTKPLRNLQSRKRPPSLAVTAPESLSVLRT